MPEAEFMATPEREHRPPRAPESGNWILIASLRSILLALHSLELRKELRQRTAFFLASSNSKEYKTLGGCLHGTSRSLSRPRAPLCRAHDASLGLTSIQQLSLL